MSKSRYRTVMEGAACWGSFYRNNPDRFAEDYLHLKLRLFQRILLIMMFANTVFVFIACRGIGKTFLSAIYCVIRCILWPHTKVCIASSVRSQSINVLEKIIQELEPISPELRAEINQKETKITANQAQIVFYNGSVIQVVTAGDSSRGKRCNVLLLDEFRLLDKDTIDTVLRKFLTLRRMPRYELLTEAERKAEYDKEKNLTLYLSSAYYKEHWSYQKCIDTFKAMLDDKRKQFVCGLPYQVSIQAGLLDPELVEDEMCEASFSDIKFFTEMGAMFFGSTEDAFFDFNTITRDRKIKYPMLPDSISCRVRDGVFKITQKQPNEKRLLSVDVALMSSRKNDNDATAIFINQLLPTKAARYVSNMVYTEAHEGLNTFDLALLVRKYFDEFYCDYLVIDCQGVGMGVVDLLVRDITDPETGEIYPALSCYNNPEIASRCTVPEAPRVIWAIKATAQQNSEMAYSLREGFRSGRVRLLIDEFEAEEILKEVNGYNKLTPVEQAKFQMPYINTTLLINELINLQHEVNGDKIKIYEKHGMRKDRYSSLSYNYYVALQLEQKLNKQTAMSADTSNVFVIKPPKYKARKKGR